MLPEHAEGVKIVMMYEQGAGSRTLAWSLPSGEQAHRTSLDLHHSVDV